MALRFWQRYPALLYAIFSYCAVWAAVQPSWIVLLIPMLCFALQPLRRSIFPILVMACMYVITLTRVHLPPDELESMVGTAQVTIEELSQGMRYGAPYWKLRLYIHQFSGEDKEAGVSCRLSGIPCTAIWKDFDHCPDTRQYYQVSGVLKRLDKTNFIFQPARNAKWIAQEDHFSLSNLRLRAKLIVKIYLRAHLPPGEARSFLEGLLLGEFHDQILAENLRRFGLTHIMVVSGFHFSLITAFIALVLRFFGSSRSFSWKMSITVLIITTTLYFFFIGLSPSVMRAWISVAILLVGKLLEKQSSGLNSLGIALIALLLYEPLFSLHIGFQLSFLATASILLFYPFFDSCLERFFVKRRVFHVLELHPLDQIGHVLITYFRKAWALNLAVHFCMLPMILYVFHSFPLLGIIYNLFFPFGVAICLSLLCFCCLISWLPWIAAPLFQLCNYLTDMLLTVVNFIPKSLDRSIILENIPGWCIVAYLSILFFLSVWLFEKKLSEKNSESLFSYL